MVARHWGCGIVSCPWHRSITGRIWSSRREFLKVVRADGREDFLISTIALAVLPIGACNLV